MTKLILGQDIRSITDPAAKLAEIGELQRQDAKLRKRKTRA